MAPLGGYVPRMQGWTTLRSELILFDDNIFIERIIRGHKYLATAITIDKVLWSHSGTVRGKEYIRCCACSMAGAS